MVIVLRTYIKRRTKLKLYQMTVKLVSYNSQQIFNVIIKSNLKRLLYKNRTTLADILNEFFRFYFVKSSSQSTGSISQRDFSAEWRFKLLFKLSLGARTVLEFWQKRKYYFLSKSLQRESRIDSLVTAR